MTQPKALSREALVAFCDAVERGACDYLLSEYRHLLITHLPAVRALLEPAADVEAFIAEHRELVSVPGGNHWAVTEDDVRALAASLRAERGWVPVTERLPMERGFYLTADRNPISGGRTVSERFFCTTQERWDLTASSEVTHWQPLPPLPTPPSDGGKEGA